VPTIDERLIDAPLQEVAKTLFKAMRTANARLTERQLDKDLFFFHQFVRRALRAPEGNKVWTGGRGGVPAAQVKAAWWTDPIGQRHWRIIGRRLDHRNSSPPCREFVPWGLWHVYPDRLALRRDGGTDELVTLCRCGVCGTPASIAWAGECCGPCHDREQEEGPPRDGLELALGLREHTAGVNCLAFQGDRLISGGQDGRIIRWDLASGEKEVLLHRPRTSVGFLAVSSTGTIATIAGGTHVRIRGLDGQWQEHALGGFRSCCLSPDGQWLAAAPHIGVLRLDVPSGARRGTLFGTRYFTGVLFSADSRTLYAAEWQGPLHRIDVTGDETREIPAGSNLVRWPRPVACSADGQWLAVTSEGGPVRLLHLPTEEWSEVPASQPQRPYWAATFTPDGRLACVGGDGGLRLWDSVRQQLSGALFLTPNLHIGYFAFSPDGERVAVSGHDGVIRVWPWRRMLEGR
jgi:WD40 repeat protein